MTEEDIIFKKQDFDISIEETEVHKSDGLDAHWLSLVFRGADLNIKMVNALRRVSMTNIPSYAIPPELIKIETNTTTAFNNDYMRERISQLPVMGVDPEIYFLHEKHWHNVNYVDPKRDKHEKEGVVEYFINAHNNTANTISVTTNDLIMNVDGKQISPYSEKYPILIIKLRPNDRFKCHMKAAFGVGDRHVIWTAARNTYYDEILDKNEASTGAYKFTIEGNDQANEYELLIRSCKYLIKKVTDLKKNIKQKMTSKEIIPTKKINFKLEREDHTLGELINYEFQDHDDIIRSGVSKPDHLVKAMLIKAASAGKVESPLEAMMECLTIVANKFNHIGKLLENSYAKSELKKK